MQPLISFEDLLKQAVKEQEARKARDRVQRGSASRGPSPKGAVQKDIETAKAWDDAFYWKDKALVASFHEQECQCCGEYNYAFTGWLLRKVHRKDAKQIRWVRVAADEAQRILAKGELPKELAHNSSQVPICAECVDTQVEGCSWDSSYNFETFSTTTTKDRDEKAEPTTKARSEGTDTPTGGDPSEDEEPFPTDTGSATLEGPDAFDGAGSSAEGSYELGQEGFVGLDSSPADCDDTGLDDAFGRLGPAPF